MRKKILLEIGQKVWILNENNRVYRFSSPDPSDTRYSREHFDEKYVVGETTQSYIIGYSPDVDIKKGLKIKKNDVSRILCLSEEDIDKVCWALNNKSQIQDRISTLRDYDKLKRIEAILNEE